MLQSLLSASASASGLTVAQLAAAGASLIAASSLFNGIGRLFWGAISDKIGRLLFRLIMGTQIAAFICLLFVRDPLLFAALVCYVLLCYGGGFGVMPSTATSLFGAPVMPIVYGTLLSAWSAGGIVGPQIAAAIADSLAAKNAAATGAAGATYAAGIAFLLLGLFFTLFLRDAKQAPR
ncbi:hypothetical protein MASR2M78_29570 [Treponema sp.]